MKMKNLFSGIKRYKWVSLVLLGAVLIIIAFAIPEDEMLYVLRSAYWLNRAPLRHDSQLLGSPHTIVTHLKAAHSTGDPLKEIYAALQIAEYPQGGPTLRHSKLFRTEIDNFEQWSGPNNLLPDNFVPRKILDLALKDYDDDSKADSFFIATDIDSDTRSLLGYNANGRRLCCYPAAHYNMDNTLKALAVADLDHLGNEEIVLLSNNSLCIVFRMFVPQPENMDDDMFIRTFGYEGNRTEIEFPRNPWDFLTSVAVGNIDRDNPNIQDVVICSVLGSIFAFRKLGHSNPDEPRCLEKLAAVYLHDDPNSVIEKLEHLREGNEFLYDHLTGRRLNNIANADVDGDGNNEIIFVHPLDGRFIHILEYRDGELVQDGDPVPIPCGVAEYIYNWNLILADVNGDSTPDILLATYDGEGDSPLASPIYIFGYNEEEEQVEFWDNWIQAENEGQEQYFYKDIVCGDLDGDGYNDLVVVKEPWREYNTDRTKLMVFRNRTESPFFRLEEGQIIDENVHACPVIADIDNNMVVDLIYAKLDGLITVLTFTGFSKFRAGWPSEHGGNGNRRYIPPPCSISDTLGLSATGGGDGGGNGKKLKKELEAIYSLRDLVADSNVGKKSLQVYYNYSPHFLELWNILSKNPDLLKQFTGILQEIAKNKNRFVYEITGKTKRVYLFSDRNVDKVYSFMENIYPYLSYELRDAVDEIILPNLEKWRGHNAHAVLTGKVGGVFITTESQLKSDKPSFRSKGQREISATIAEYPSK